MMHCVLRQERGLLYTLPDAPFFKNCEDNECFSRFFKLCK